MPQGGGGSVYKHCLLIFLLICVFYECFHPCFKIFQPVIIQEKDETKGIGKKRFPIKKLSVIKQVSLDIVLPNEG